MQTGDQLDLEITNVAHGGVFIGRYVEPGADPQRGGRVVFVPDVIPGERVRVRLTQVGEKSFWRGEAIEILDASPHRRAHIWPEADVSRPPEARPGGADFGHIDLAHQRMLKLEVLRDALSRMAGLEIPLTIEGALPTLTGGKISEQESPDGSRWRTRLGLHVGDDGRAWPFGARSHRVVPVASHPLATAELERAALAVRGADPGRIDLVHPSDGRIRVIPRPVDPRTGRPQRLRTHEVITEVAGEREFRVDADGFWQVHRLAADTLHSAVTWALRSLVPDGPAIDAGASHLDLYGGVGLFATVLAQSAISSTHIATVESDERATLHAGENTADWVGVRAVTARVDRFLARLEAEASAAERAKLAAGTVVLDPPRAGAGGAVVASLTRLAPSSIVYVACDPVALARDLATFRQGGYSVTGIQVYDLFPHSHHLEAVASLTRDARLP